MRKKIIMMATAMAAIVLSIFVNKYAGENRVRYHQHMEAPAKIEVQTEGFSTHLPLISIDTGGQEIPGMNKDGSTITADFELRDSDEYYSSLTDEPVLESKARIRYRGNSSLHFDKKSFSVKLVTQDGTPNEVELLGMDKEEEWILNGPYLDKTLMRNYMMMNISGEIMDYAPEVRFCELFIDGEYRGVYLLMESISRSRVEVGKAMKEKTETPYIIRLDRLDESDVNLNNFSRYIDLLTVNAINVVYPASDKITEEKLRFIEEDFSKFEKSLYSLDYDDPALGYEKYINVSSFVDYFIINEFFQNYDAGSYSTYMNKTIGGKINMGPVWDFNNAMDNYFETDYDGTDFRLQDKPWYFMLTKDERFIEKVIRRYRELRSTVLSEDYLERYIDDTVVYLGESIDRNFAVWGYTFEPEHGLLEPAERNISSYDEAINQIKNFIAVRGAWLDKNIELLRQFCHRSKVKKYMH